MCNLHGDVISITDSNGNKVVTYIYDAWGKVINITGRLANTLGKDNPIRYRGYYYDEETGFYYLQSRYYDPETCRFLNADTGLLPEYGNLGMNLYLYCLNNAVNMFDSNGMYPVFIYAQYDSVKVDLNGDGKLVPMSDIELSTSFLVHASLAQNGCGIIALYNVMQMADENVKLNNVIFYMKFNGGLILHGLLGVNPSAIGRYLLSNSRYAIRTATALSGYNKWYEIAERSYSLIILYKNPGGLSMHYVSAIQANIPENLKHRMYMFLNCPYVVKNDPMRLEQYINILLSKDCTPLIFYGLELCLD